MDDPLAYVVTELKARRADWRAIAEASGVPLGTLKQVGTEVTKNPTHKTVMDLAYFFRNGCKRPKPAKRRAAAADSRAEPVS